VRKLAVVILIGLCLLVGCGSERSSDPGAGGNAANSSDPDTPVTNTPGTTPPGQEPPTKGGAQRVTPNPDAVDARPQNFTKAKTLNHRTVRVFFYQGVAPCSVLQRVEVEYGTQTIGITLHVGHEETDVDVACIEIAVYNFVDVSLDESIDGRKIVDASG
jgi:hypothetical protein